MNCYKIELDATNLEDRNLLLLEAEVKYALLQDYEYICDVNDKKFRIYENDLGVCMDELDTNPKSGGVVPEPSEESETPNLLSDLLYLHMHKISSRPSLSITNTDQLMRLMQIYRSARELQV